MAKSLFLPTPISQEIMTSPSKKRKVSKKSSKKRKFSKAQKKTIRNLYKKSYKNKRSPQVINVAEDKEYTSKSYKKQRVTKHQQRLINKRFKNGYSPFILNKSDVLQLTGKYDINKCKWIWRSQNTLKLIVDNFQLLPQESKAPGAQSTVGNYYINSPEQSLYFGKFKYKYEIMNPTNIDMNLVIYDIVYKEDTLRPHADSAYYESISSFNNLPDQTSSITPIPLNDDYSNPIALIMRGYEKEFLGNSNAFISDSIAPSYDSINSRPTYSYPFNIYCNIVKKHEYRLQPGATMTHVFTHKPKCLMNKGYLYKYSDDLSNNNVTLGIKNFTSGCLFKFWGQLGNSGDDSEKGQVLTQSGKLVIKEYFTANWYSMDNKYKYIFNDETAWNASNANIDKTEVINNANVKEITEMNIDATDNNVPPNT